MSSQKGLNKIQTSGGVVYDLAGKTIDGNTIADLTDLGSTANAKGASRIGIEDSGSIIVATTVEGALAENREGVVYISDNNQLHNAITDGDLRRLEVDDIISFARKKRDLKYLDPTSSRYDADVFMKRERLRVAPVIDIDLLGFIRLSSI